MNKEVIRVETKEENIALIKARNNSGLNWGLLSTKDRINFDNNVILSVRNSK